ncbi:hypothetical protein [Cryptosporangium arvum]|uniref:Uncharacterized protein n=1 Tax=Cryptosporangium arvum DSM 44712 TaxID=927661 RepID=A0A010YM07_9ACTN|nr:hypothetical protein [Cryptosporangium arvum]EXG81240.1 hypothetical protein CryarDRAFT_2349 [Cryptosporangium arvum DSM 44712]
MAETVEAALARSLDRAAEAAPEPAPDLAAALTRRYHQRTSRRSSGRSRLIVVAAAFAVVVVLATAITAVRTIRDQHPPTTVADARALAFLGPAAPVVERADYPDGAAIDQVWPTAWGEVSGTPPIARFLPGGRVLTAGPESPIVSLDATTGAKRAISPAGQSYFAIGEPANAGAEKWIVWAVLAAGGRAEIWRAPVDGGAAARVTTLEPITNVRPTELRLTVVDDVVLIDPYPGVTGRGNVGVLWVPLDGSSAPALIPGSHDYRYLQWPWFGSTAVMNNSTIWNAVTGERLTTPLNWESMSCSRSWCVGREQNVVLVGRHDGSDVRKLALAAGRSTYRIVADRFVVGTFAANGGSMYDLVARKYLTLPPAARSEQWETAQLSGATSTNPFYVWTVTAPGRPTSLRVLQVGKMR